VHLHQQSLLPVLKPTNGFLLITQQFNDETGILGVLAIWHQYTELGSLKRLSEATPKTKESSSHCNFGALYGSGGRDRTYNLLINGHYSIDP